MVRADAKAGAQQGFDACASLNGRLMLFQFKASRHLLRNGDRKFQFDHKQLVALTRHTGTCRCSVYYAFPLVGIAGELYRSPDLLANTLLLDVSKLGTIGAPRKADGAPRASRRHHARVRRSMVTIYSDPVDAALEPMSTFAEREFRPEVIERDAPIASEDVDFGGLNEMQRYFSAGARGLVVYRS